MRFEELSKERQESILNEYRDINVNYDWWGSCLEDICEQISDRIGINLKTDDLGFDFFSKGSSGLWVNGGELRSALSDKFNDLEDLDISEQFGVWAYIGLRRDEIEKEDIEFCREEEDDDLADLLKERWEEEEKEKVVEDVEELLDIFAEGYGYLYDEYCHLTSDEGIIETIKCNEMEFEDED